MPGQACIICKGKIETMAFKGTLVCSDKCRKRLVETHAQPQPADTAKTAHISAMEE